MSSTQAITQDNFAREVAREVAESILASPKLDSGSPSHGDLSSVSLSAYPGQHPPISDSSLSSPTPAPSVPPTEAFAELKISNGRYDHRSKDYQDDDEEGGSYLELYEDGLEGKRDGKDRGPDLCNLFVGDLARTVTEDVLREAFAKQGEVVSVDIKRDKITNNNLGYGFVQFKTREQAIAAREALHGTEVGGRKIRIGWAQKNTTLFIGDLDGTVSTPQLREIFAKFGPLVEEETFVKAGSGKFGFVRYKHRADAERAKAEMNRKVIGSRPIRIGWGDNNIQKHCVHVQFNPTQGAHLQEAHFRKHFEQFGTVQNVSLPRFANRRLKGYGFIHFQENNEGEKAAGKAIATLAESKVANVVIRCSYGKRQIYNRYRRHPKNMGRGFSREPIYSQAWAITMGPPGSPWPMMQPYGQPGGGVPGSHNPYFLQGRGDSEDPSLYLQQQQFYPGMFYPQGQGQGGFNYPLQSGQVMYEDMGVPMQPEAYAQQAAAQQAAYMKQVTAMGESPLIHGQGGPEYFSDMSYDMSLKGGGLPPLSSPPSGPMSSPSSPPQTATESP